MSARSKLIRVVAPVAVLGLVAAGCGDDDDATASTPPVAATPATEAPSTDAPVNSGAAQPGDELCALAAEMFGQETPPTHAQLTRYRELAPGELREPVEFAAAALLAAPDGDFLEFFKVIARDDVTDAIEQIDAFEEALCGIPHSENSSGPGEGATADLEDDAARVDVVATDYAFDAPATLDAGRTSFVLTNDGAEVHFLMVVRLVEGINLDTALAAGDPDTVVEQQWESGLAATGGDDEEALTVDLEPGDYGMLCFIPTADGTPHAFVGMALPFTVG